MAYIASLQTKLCGYSGIVGLHYANPTYPTNQTCHALCYVFHNIYSRFIA